METKRLRDVGEMAQCSSRSSGKMMSYCIIRSKLKRAKDENEDSQQMEEFEQGVGCNQHHLNQAHSHNNNYYHQDCCHKQPNNQTQTPVVGSSSSSIGQLKPTASRGCLSSTAAPTSQIIAITPNNYMMQQQQKLWAKLQQTTGGTYQNQAPPTSGQPPTSATKSTQTSETSNNCQQQSSSAQNGLPPQESIFVSHCSNKNTTTAGRYLIGSGPRRTPLPSCKSPMNWSLLISLTFVCLALTNWQPLPPPPTAVPANAGTGNGFSLDQQHQSGSLTTTSTTTTSATLSELIYGLLAPARVYLAKRSVQLAEAQYRPDWPSKSLQQEIFLLNLEDGYFGCQVNESQDFLQLFELSRLCDGQAQCYLGTDEMASPLKCNNRERCGTYQNSRGQQESFHCVNGVCLDGLCYCNDGFGGKACDVPDENECKFRPCDVFAHCTNTMGSYYCSCFPGYDGDGMHCQDINECEIPSLAALCSDNSECCNLPGHFVCKCKPGFQQSGQSQSSLSDIDECLDERACGKDATCENLPGSFRCSCPPGFTGDPAVECIDMDECRNNPCGIGAQCTNIPGGYRCSCAPGFERSPSFPANMFGTIQTSTGSSAAISELTNTSLVACLDINECSQPTPPGGKSICGSGAQCINTPGAYFCQCPPNYTGNPKVACLDIDECAAHVCGSNTECSNTPGGYHCECKQGYTGNAYSAEGCQDEDECLRKEACGLNAQCFNTLGSHECSCLSGFTGDPMARCTDIDECANGNPCGPGAQCNNLAGGYKCACPDKYLARGSPEMGCERAAVDIGCQGDYDCTRNALCVNSTCQCKLGFQINGIECVDIDECSLGQTTNTSPPPPSTSTLPPLKAFTKLSIAIQQQQELERITYNNQTQIQSEGLILCGSEAQCVNTEGSYRCECRAGYEKVDPMAPKSKCRDVNECEQHQSIATGGGSGGSQVPCGQNSKCFNTDGAFKCACSDGFIPIDQDPANGCKSPCDGVNCGQHATCKPHGEEAACVCKPGFTFDPNNIKLGCVDINECDTNYGPSGLCGQRAVCTNIPGSYRCHCPSGYSGDAERYCEDINECDRKFGVFGQCGELAVCNNTAGSYTCSCAPGYTGDPRQKCHDIDECSTSKFGPSGKCGQGALCTNLPGKFLCRCPADYSGDPYDRCQPEQPVCSTQADCALNQVCKSGRCHCPFAHTSATSTTAAAAGSNSPDDYSATSGLQECRHPCDKTECGSHATCQLDNDNQALCVCDAGYMAPGDGRSGCVDVNECIQGVTLSGITPLSALTSGRGGVALGPAGSLTTIAPPSATAAANANTNSSSHPCGRNALCRNHPGSFDCVCPPGYSGDAYQNCIMDVRNQVQPPAPVLPAQQQHQHQQHKSTQAPDQQLTVTNVSQTGGAFGNYQQEPRTTSCSETCPRGHVCSDGQCVKPDSCRDNYDCRSTMACEHVNQIRGFQCVNVCELSHCGPEAKCTPMNHKPICSCNSTAGYAGDPYDLVHGCQLQSYDVRQQQQLTSTTSSSFGLQLNTLTTKNDHLLDAHRTTLASGSATGSQQQGDLSTVSFDPYGPQISQQQQLSSTTHYPVPNITFEQQLQRQQQQQQQQHGYDVHREDHQAVSTSRRPNQPLTIANNNEFLLPTTPILPQFSPFGQPPTIVTNSIPQQQQQQQNLTSFSSEQNKQANQQFLQPTSGQVVAGNQSPALMPQQTQTTIVNQLTSTTVSRQQQQQQQIAQQNLFTTTKKKPQQQQQQPNVISNNNNQLNTANRQDSMIDSSPQKQQNSYEQQRQNQQQQSHDQDQQVLNHVSSGHKDFQQQQQQQQQVQQNFNPFVNKSSSLITNYVFTHKQVACTSDQHCPGNLFCLSSDQAPTLSSPGGNSLVRTNQKICGCPPGYRREADYCYMQRTNCTSSAPCKPREECISSVTLQQYYASSSLLIQQQIAISGGSGSRSQQQFNLAGGDEYTGICVCPRGYKLTTSGVACIDRNECDEGTPCAVGAICQNKIGSYECVCPPGSIGEPYTKTCEPIVGGVGGNDNNNNNIDKDLECKSNSECPNDRECDLQARRCVSPCYVCGPRAICTAANHVAICLCPPRYTGNAIDLVYGCQEPAITTMAPPTTTTGTSTTTRAEVQTTMGYTNSLQTTTARPTSINTNNNNNNNYTNPTTAVGVPVTTLLPATTTMAPLESTTPELVEFRTIPPSELFVMCLADGIQVEVQLGGFDGIIYVKGHSQDPKCRKLVMSSNANEFVDFKVQFGHCDLIHRDGEAGFVLVIQKHPKLVTYRARAYHVKCVYNTGERTVTLGFNVSMITTSGTIANTGPPPTCLMSITALDGREVTSAEIGQDLLLRVDVQPDSIYGGFARSCEAKTMDDEGEYQYEVTDANGCATDPSIFSDWKYDQQRKSLVARFNAFKFPSSNNLRFQCNIRVCFGSCPAVNCNGIDAYGKRRRRREAIGSDRLNASALADDDADLNASSSPTSDEELIVTDAFKEGALREEVMVQSNAILTFDRKEEASLPQQSRPQVEDIEFVCLPRLGIMMSIVLTTLIALLALAIGTSCWCFTKRKRQNRLNGPLPHPLDFPNPLLRSSSVSTLREPIYGP